MFFQSHVSANIYIALLMQAGNSNSTWLRLAQLQVSEHAETLHVHVFYTSSPKNSCKILIVQTDF